MARRRRRLRGMTVSLLMLIGCLSTSGCWYAGTTCARINSPYTEKPFVYPATAFDLDEMGGYTGWFWPKWMSCVDLPLAVVTDTVLLPWDTFNALTHSKDVKNTGSAVPVRRRDQSGEERRGEQSKD